MLLEDQIRQQLRVRQNVGANRCLYCILHPSFQDPVKDQKNSSGLGDKVHPAACSSVIHNSF